MTIAGATVGAEQWGRCVRITVNDTVIENFDGDGLDLSFRTFRHNRPEPNECDVTIYNLAEADRDRLTAQYNEARETALEQRLADRKSDFEQSLGKIFGDKQERVREGSGIGPFGKLRIEAGRSPGDLRILAEAEISELDHDPPRQGGVDWVTNVKAMDGWVPWREGFVSQSVAPGVDISDLMKVLTSSWQAALGADAEKALLEGLSNFNARKVDGMGYVLHGPHREVATNLLDSMNLAVSFQNGEIQFLPYDGTTNDFAVVLDYDTGLLDRPYRRALGKVQAMAYIDADLHPGRQIQLLEFGDPVGAGIFRIDQVEQIGETFGNSWTATLQLRPTALT